MQFRLFLESSGFTYVYHASPESNIHKLTATGSNVGIQAINQRKAGIYVAPSEKEAKLWATSFIMTKKRRARPFKTITIYKIKIPKDLLNRVWYNNEWQKEYFIPEEEIHNLEIVSKKTYSSSELTQYTSHIDGKRMELYSTQTQRVAKKIALTNMAAKEYLKFHRIISDRVLSGKNRNLPKLKELLKDLTRLFYIPGDFRARINYRLNTEQERQVKEIIKDINYVMSYANP